MSNYYTDNSDITFYLDHLDLEEIVRLKEGDFTDAGEHQYAPRDVEDALDNYRLVLTMLGELAGERMAPRAPDVDKEGCRLVDGKVEYAEGIRKAIEELAQADLMGMTLPRQYGGLNFPTTVYSMAIEIISRADASLMTIFGLQDIAETIKLFADQETKNRYLPKFCSGEVTGAMVLTEPDAGSDLQAVMLRATEDKENGTWRLNGVKRFISNGCGQVLLVLARSEEGTRDARGLSLFLCEAGEEVRIRRLEEKLGIRGSPTCEMQFVDAPAILIGRRRMGLIRYVMSLMNGARLGISGQAIGIAQACYMEAIEYAESREQFGKAIRHFPAVREMLVGMKVQIEAMRALTLETARIVDLESLLEEDIASGREKEKDRLAELRKRQSQLRRWAGLLTPMVKYYTTERLQTIAHDAVQVHGGSGYMKDYNVERHYRDARITNIYEGTSQLQVVAAIGGISSGVFQTYCDDLLARVSKHVPEDLLSPLQDRLKKTLGCIEFLKSKEKDYQDLYARDMTELAVLCVTGLLLLDFGRHSERKRLVSQEFLCGALPQMDHHAARIRWGGECALTHFEEITGE